MGQRCPNVPLLASLRLMKCGEGGTLHFFLQDAQGHLPWYPTCWTASMPSEPGQSMVSEVVLSALVFSCVLLCTTILRWRVLRSCFYGVPWDWAVHILVFPSKAFRSSKLAEKGMHGLIGTWGTQRADSLPQAGHGRMAAAAGQMPHPRMGHGPSLHRRWKCAAQENSPDWSPPMLLQPRLHRNWKGKMEKTPHKQ